MIISQILKCRNFDGGFGSTYGAESHAGQGELLWIIKPMSLENRFKVFVCVSTLAILDRLELVDTPTLAWWLAERQLPNGGLNGRPEKLEDVCRSVYYTMSADQLC